MDLGAVDPIGFRLNQGSISGESLQLNTTRGIRNLLMVAKRV